MMETIYRGVRWLVGKFPPLNKIAVKLEFWGLMRKLVPRPHPFSLWSPEKKIEAVHGESQQERDNKKEAGRKIESSDYTSWPGLVDRTYSGRHLPPDDHPGPLPDPEAVVALMMRPEGQFRPSPVTTTLFPFFAQWFTDSFLRVHPLDRRLNTSNHEIDLCQIYGLKESTTDLLRTKPEAEDGKLKHRMVELPGVAGKLQMLPETLLEPDSQSEHGYKVKEEFLELPYAPTLFTDVLVRDFAREPSRLKFHYALGLERGNSTIGYSAVSTIFLREHNRLCDLFKKAHPQWKGDRLFQTARNTNIALLLKIIVEDYVNHLGDPPVKLRVDIGLAEKQKWYRTNRIAIEFDLLYRWHGLVPDTFELGGETLLFHQFMFNNPLVEQHGVEAIITAAARQQAGHIALGNIPAFLREAEMSALSLSRQFKVRPYNDYRERFALKRVRSFRELTGEQAMARKLEDLYQSVDRVEFLVGLRAENYSGSTALGKLMFSMVGFDAFSQALTNPLLSENVFSRQTFSEEGYQAVAETSRFRDVVMRNLADGVNPEDMWVTFYQGGKER